VNGQGWIPAEHLSQHLGKARRSDDPGSVERVGIGLSLDLVDVVLPHRRWGLLPPEGDPPLGYQGTVVPGPESAIRQVDHDPGRVGGQAHVLPANPAGGAVGAHREVHM